MGTVLFSGLGPGLGATINPFDPDYEKKLLAANRQASADTANTKLATEYVARAKDTKERNIQQQANHLPLLTIDPPPHKWIIDANGNQVQSTDLVTSPLSVIPDPPVGAAPPQNVMPVSASMPMDRTDLLLARVDRLTAMTLAIAQKMGLAIVMAAALLGASLLPAQVFAQAPVAPLGTSGQVILRMIPEPMAVPASVLAHARDLGRWTVVVKNNTAATVTVYAEDILIASGNIAFVTPDDALLVLNGHIRRSGAARLVTVLMYAGKAAAIGMAVASRSNFGWSAGIGIGTSLLPDVVAIVQGSVPSAVPLASSVKWPVDLPPGGALLDHMFAAKTKNPRPVTAVITR
jgi:hypothetical protein